MLGHIDFQHQFTLTASGVNVTKNQQINISVAKIMSLNKAIAIAIPSPQKRYK